MPSGQREVRLDRLRDLNDNERGLLTNARCLSEGVDVPTLDGVTFVDTRRSQVDIVQAVGRAIRKAENKTVGTIILPVFIESTEDPETVLKSSAFNPIWSVLKALRSHDEQFAEHIDGLRQELGRGAMSVTLPSKIRIDLPTAIGLDFVEAFRVRLVESATASWESWYGLLEKFVESEGHSNVTATFVMDGRHLGHWCNNQRVKFRKGRLSAKKIERLETLGFVWEPHELAWHQGFELLKRFVEREGHSRVPQKHIEAGFGLGPWCNAQRLNFRQGELTSEKISRLESLEFGWEPHQLLWEQSFSQLIRFVEREGHADVPAKHVENGFKLGGWCSNQRSKQKNGSLSERRAAQLEDVGFRWDIRASYWDEGFRHLKTFVEREGHASVRRSFAENGFPLGTWCNDQRHDYRQKSLTAEQTDRLEILDFEWEPLETAWVRAFDHLRIFVEREGHANVPQRHVESSFQLGTWCANQRGRYRRGTTPDERAKQLEALGFRWNSYDAAWDEGFSYLLRFHEREGHTHVPRNHLEDGYRLGQWSSVQRSKYRKGSMPDERFRKLERLGFVWDVRKR